MNEAWTELKQACAQCRRCMAIYHPSALLRDPNKRPETFVDLKTLQREIYARCPEVYPDA